MADGLERDLRDLGRHLAWPGSPDLTAAVAEELGRGPARPVRRRVTVLAAAALLLLAGLLAASPGLRAAILDLFRLPGARIEVDPEPSPVPVAPGRLEELVPGRAVTLAEARAATAFRITVPATLGRPDEVVLVGQGSDAVVTLAWRGRPGLPPADETGYAALLTQLRARPTEELIKKVSAATGVTPVTVDGEQGYWVQGPHPVILERDGEVVEDLARLSSSSLLWTRDGVLMRLEADLTLIEALRLARSGR